MTEELIQTKISIPPLRMQLVHRERLYRRLDAGARCRLTLVAAPAGFGKSTLLGSWAERQEIPLGWYSLDEQDNDPDRFLAYLLAALQSVAPQLELREGTAALRQTRQGAVDQALLTFLANRVQEYAQPLGIVLDDYHVIANPAVDEILSFLLEHMPLSFHLIVSSRQEPAFPVARLRAAGQVQAISEQDLRFTSEEAAQFLEQGMGLQIQPEDIAALEARTEGWIAGLQLAALSLEGRPDPAAFIASLRGTDRYILDYLAEEVFARLPGPLQIFLLRLSIVDRFGEGLCDALAADGPDAEWSLGGDARGTLADHRSRTVLEFLDSSNLFVVPLDHERRWYRFHQLFADFLFDRLQALHPDWIPDLRRRAAEWYASEGLAADAIHQALLAQEPRLAASLIEGQVRTMLTHGQTGTLTRWIESLPDDTLSARPELLLALAWSQLLGDVVRNQASIIRIASRLGQCLGTSRETVALRLGEQSLAAGERGTLGQYALLMAFLGRDSVPLEETVSLFQAALGAIPPDDLFARGMGLGGLGSTYARQGRLSLAERTFADSAETTRRHESPYAYLVAKDWEATVQSAQGLLMRAGSTYRGVIERLREMSAERLPLTGHAFVGLADILREQNDLQAALEHVTEGLHRGQLIMDHDALREGYLIQARILAAVGDDIGTHRALEAGLEEARMIGSQACLQEAEAWEAMLNLAWGDTAAAIRWATRRDLLGSLDQERAGMLEPIEQRALARLLAVQGRHAQAASVLEDVVRTADAGEQARLALEARCALSVLLHAVGDRDGAMRALAKALLFGEPEAYLRSFVDEGPRMAALLHRAAAEGHSPAYAQRILAAFGHERPAESLVEPLTERELEVLRLLAEGLTNAQIAAKLVVAQSTVKTHIHHLYGRLGVTGRTQAAARARELRLLE